MWPSTLHAPCSLNLMSERMLTALSLLIRPSSLALCKTAAVAKPRPERGCLVQTTPKAPVTGYKSSKGKLSGHSLGQTNHCKGAV